MATTKVELGSKYKTGDKSPLTGTYVCEECEKAGTQHHIKVTEGAAFPPCDGMDVKWRLESYEPMA